MRRLIINALFLICAASPLGGCNVLAPFYGSSEIVVVDPETPYATLDGRARLATSASWDFVKSYEHVHWRRDDLTFDVRKVIRACESFDARAVGMYAYDHNDRSKRVVYPTERTIVCLEPLIVLETDSPQKAVLTDSMLHVPVGNPWTKVAFVTLQLPSGYRAGVTVDHDENVRWFSPTLSQRPTRVEGEGDRRFITVPDGRLELHRRGDRWRVLACPD